jgi:hypothetical protein
MSNLFIISAIITVIGGIATLGFYFNDNIEKKIEAKINNPEFLKKVAAEAQLPFVIFNEDESIIADTGAMKYIEKIEVKKTGNRDITEIVISPSQHLSIAPLIESIGPELEFNEPIRGKNFDWIYIPVEYASRWQDSFAGTPPPIKFKLQLIVSFD